MSLKNMFFAYKLRAKFYCDFYALIYFGCKDEHYELLAISGISKNLVVEK